MSKHIFLVCSHIQKNTTNPNIIFEISIYCTKYINNTKNSFEQIDLFEIIEQKKLENENMEIQPFVL